jgi:uncharacterized membrane protein YhaH (DUF805 family)
MNFGQAIASLYKNYANFKGRSRRSAYWFAYLFYVAVAIPISLFSTQVDLYTGAVTYGPLYYIWVLGNMLPVLAVGVRRMHDVGKSGWFVLVPIYSIILCATDSAPGDNFYGTSVK